jgi:hypothetical protein
MLAILMPSPTVLCRAVPCRAVTYRTVPCANCCVHDLALLRLRLSSSSEHNSPECAYRVKAGFIYAKYCIQCLSRCDVFPVHLHAVPGVSSYKM